MGVVRCDKVESTTGASAHQETNATHVVQIRPPTAGLGTCSIGLEKRAIKIDQR
jgi:hypothetical protein